MDSVRLQQIGCLLALLIAAAIASALAVYGWRRRPAVAAAPFAWGMLAVACWSFGYALELASADLSTKVFWTRIEYMGIIVAPVAALALVLQYTWHDRWWARCHWLPLGFIPAVSILLVWTNDMHHLFYENLSLDTSGILWSFDLW